MDIGFFNFGGFGLMFGFMQLFVGAMFILVFGMILFRVVQGIGQWNKNNHSPILSVEAKVISRRMNVHQNMHHDMHNEMHHSTTSTSYYMTFEVESGDRIEFSVPEQVYGMHVEGDTGKLTFQGTRYLEFIRRKISVFP